tara:strand:- start:100 stop:345 length:246 start_codon:yes stop_codon:yes gene_type:complete
MSDRNVLNKLQELETEVLRLSALSDAPASDYGVSFTIEDTDLLINILNESHLKGSQVIIAAKILPKLHLLHKILLKKGVKL